jgi:alkylation response protein AidB-like acyl-CoA dehydrogenase
MNFELDETQIAIRDLARRVFAEHERHKELEAAGETFDRRLLDALRTTGLLDVDGFVEQCIVLIEQGRTVAPVPLWAHYVASAACGSSDRFATVAFDNVAPTDQADCVVSVRYQGVMVGSASSARRRRTTAGAEFVLELDEGRPLGFDPAELVRRAHVARCAFGVGVAERALELTANYVSQRTQFDRPLGSFQAVQQRAANAYIDVEAMRLTMWQAAWRIDQSLDAQHAVDVARFWASDAGQRVVGTAQHLHGGIGADIDYPLHRYTVAMKEIELAFGGATETLARMGSAL